MKKLIIEARINEYMMRNVNPHVPWTPEEIAETACACRDAGAAILHFHARKPNGEPAHDVDTYAEIIHRVREKCDILINPTLGFVALDASAEERIKNIVELSEEPTTRPDIAPTDMGSINIDRFVLNEQSFFETNQIYKNSTATLIHFVKAISRAKVKHNLVSWSVGFTRRALAFVNIGLVPEPVYLLFLLTDGEFLTGHPGTLDGLDAHLRFLPADKKIEWTVCNVGGSLLLMIEKIIVSGGHIAIGLGDHSYPELNMPTNDQLISHVSKIAEQCDRETSSPQEAKEILCIAEGPGDGL